MVVRGDMDMGVTALDVIKSLLPEVGNSEDVRARKVHEVPD
jgi:hypothetical protein